MAIHFGGNDYLDLASDPRTLSAAKRALDEWGVSSCASRASVGTRPVHSRLEEAIAEFLGAEAAVVLSSGYLAAIAALEALGSGGPAPSHRPALGIHELAHVSLKHAARVLQAELLPCSRPAADSRPLAAVLCDGVDGFNGLIAPLSDLAGCAREHTAPLLIDDAHGLGVLGAEGRGSWSAFGLSIPDHCLVIIGSFGKALGSTGGFVAASRALVQEIQQRGCFLGSTALAPPQAAAALTALEISRREPERRERLLELARALRFGLLELGLRLIGPPLQHGFIFPVGTLEFSSAEAAGEIADALSHEGIHLAHFRYAGASSSRRIRIPLSARHRLEDVKALLAGLEPVVHQSRR